MSRKQGPVPDDRDQDWRIWKNFRYGIFVKNSWVGLDFGILCHVAGTFRHLFFVTVKCEKSHFKSRKGARKCFLGPLTAALLSSTLAVLFMMSSVPQSFPFWWWTPLNFDTLTYPMVVKELNWSVGQALRKEAPLWKSNSLILLW